MAKSVDDTFNLILLDELIGNSVILAISLYYVIMVRYVINIMTESYATLYIHFYSYK